MLTAKREDRREEADRRVICTGSKRRAETPPSWVRERHVRRAPPAARAEPAILIEDRVDEVIQVAPPPGVEPSPTPEAEPAPLPGQEPAASPEEPAPSATKRNLLVIFKTNADNSPFSSPMLWDHMVPPDGVTPSLKQVHDNLVEDGLHQFDKYTLHDPEGVEVKSDRSLNYRLSQSLERRVTKEEWTVVIHSRFPILLCWSEG